MWVYQQQSTNTQKSIARWIDVDLLHVKCALHLFSFAHYFKFFFLFFLLLLFFLFFFGSKSRWYVFFLCVKLNRGIFGRCQKVAQTRMRFLLMHFCTWSKSSLRSHCQFYKHKFIFLVIAHTMYTQRFKTFDKIQITRASGVENERKNISFKKNICIYKQQQRKKGEYTRCRR